MVKIRADRRRQEAAKQFSPFAVANERYEDLAPPPKPSRPRRKQVYKSRVVGKCRGIQATDLSPPHGRSRSRFRR